MLVRHVLAVLLLGATACHAPVRTVSSAVHLSSHDREVACSLYRSLRDAQGEAYERRVVTELGDRMDDC